MNRGQNSQGLVRNLVPQQIIQKRRRRRGKIKMDDYDLRNLLNSDKKPKSTSNKRSHEDDIVSTKKLKNQHVPSIIKSPSSLQPPTTPSGSQPPISQRTSNNFKSPSTSSRLSLNKDLDFSSIVRKSNKNVSPFKESRRYSSSLKKNIAAQRLENLRKTLPESSYSASSPTIIKGRSNRRSIPNDRLSTVVRLNSASSISTIKKEVHLSNNRLSNTLSPPGRSNRSSFANDRLSALRDKLLAEATEKINSIQPSTATNNMEYVEEMEWEQLPEERIIKDIVEIRNSAQKNPNIFKGLESSFCFHENMDMVFNKSSVREKSKFIIIIDTNIFLSNLQIVKNLLNCNCYDNDLTIVIPWMVFQELDFFKTQSSKLIKNAQTAVRFINGELANKNPKLKGQTAFEATEHVIKCQGPDDRILDCSLQYKSDNNITIILTNDINLRNKALVNNIEAYSSDEILKVIAMKMENINKISVPIVDKDLEEKFRQFHKILSIFLIKILEREMYKAYGDVWKQMVQFKSTWTVPTIIKCILKYWKSVFSFVYPKHLRPCISTLLQSFDDCELSDPDLKNLIDTALAVCLHLQNISEEYFHIIFPIIKELKNLL